MKLIECYVQPYNLDIVCEQLILAGARGVSVSEVKGFGVQRGFKPSEGAHAGVKLLPKLKVETVVGDDEVEGVIEKFSKALNTGHVGEGKIFVYDVQDAVRIRTGERGEAAIK